MPRWRRSKWRTCCVGWNLDEVSIHRARSLARRLALQALYQLQINPRTWQETLKQFADDPEADRVDRDYFAELITAIGPAREALDLRLGAWSEIPPAELDPIEHAVLWLGVHELGNRPELPYRVALDEAVQLAKQFGATDGHKYINAVLDRAAKELRPDEYRQNPGSPVANPVEEPLG
jgi:N utilization substance protein B